MKKALVFVLVAMLAMTSVFAGGSKESDGPRTLRLATDAALDYPTTKALSYFADKVKEYSEGRITVEIYANTLGDEISYLEQLQMGTVDIGKFSIGTLSGFYDDLQVFNLPFLFRDGNEMWKVLESEVGDRVLTGLEEYGLRGIGFTDNGSRCFYTTFPVETIKDFSGRTIRVQQNHVMLSLVSLLGANPVNVSANEMYSALQTGVCQGGENNLNTILADSLYEVAKYVTLDNHTTGMDTIVFNLDVWNSFSEEDQQMMLRAMDEATAYDREIWDASIEDAKAKLTAGGAIITTPAPEVQDSFFDAMAPLYEEYSVEYGDWIESINEVLGR